MISGYKHFSPKHVQNITKETYQLLIFMAGCFKNVYHSYFNRKYQGNRRDILNYESLFRVQFITKWKSHWNKRLLTCYQDLSGNFFKEENLSAVFSVTDSPTRNKLSIFVLQSAYLFIAQNSISNSIHSS